ncbi:amidohydrolase family protein [bacterium]|nr:amidohydrolase family protein [bacterium]
MNKLRIMNPFGKPEFLDDAAIIIEDGNINSIISGHSPDGFQGDIFDMGGKTVLPGMINAHTHLYSSLALGMPPPKNIPGDFVEILKEIWWKLDLALDHSSAQASFESGLLDCILNGVTTVIDHHASPNFVSGSLDLLVASAEKFGINISVCFEASDRNGLENFQQELDESLHALEKYRDHPHVLPLIGLHASFTLSDESLQKVSDSLQGHQDWGIHIHVAEDLADERDAKSRGYASVIERLDHFSLLNNRCLIVHGIFITRQDRQTLLQHGCKLIHNPSSNANNRVGILETEIIDSLHAGLGTDGKQNNMLAEVNQGLLIRSAKACEPVNYLELLFKNNPNIASHLFAKSLGRISAGAQADLVFYDYHPRTEIHADNFMSHILYGFEKPSDVMSHGIFRVRNGRLPDIDAGAILENAKIQSSRVWEAMQKH